MKQRDSMIFYRSFYEAMSTLNDADFRKLAEAVFNFGLGGEEEELDGAIKGMFLLIKPQIEANSRRYENGCKGGRPRKDSDKCELEENQTETKQKADRNQTESKPKPNDNVNVNESDKNVNDKSIPPTPQMGEEATVYQKELSDKVKNIYCCTFEDFWAAYPRRDEKSRAYKYYQARLKDGFSEDELLRAARGYAEECRKDKREKRYIKLASTFLSATTPFVDYLNDDDKKGGIEDVAAVSGSFKL